jgi:WhiB family redox-sensing transcriptional regulator
VPDHTEATAHDQYRRLVLREDPRGGSTSWMAHGACRGSDPELFFPIADDGFAAEQVMSARAVCGRCDVATQCLSYAQRTMPDGIWGGTTREERITVRARLAPHSARPAGR